MSEVLIDGALPRTEAERVSKLLDYANTILDKAYRQHTGTTFPYTEQYRKYHELNEEYILHYPMEDWAFWHELEDEVIDLITELLPDNQICTIGFNPGDVLVMGREELEKEGD